MIDLRSDTVTRPCPAMREAMARADVDDDVIDIDPTVARLQDCLAEMLGKEAAIFVPSGTMANQIALRLHCQPGDEFICEEACHIYNYEQGAYAQLSGLAVRTVPSDNGLPALETLQGLIRPDNEHAVRTKLLCLENTHNLGGGRILPYDDVQAVCQWAQDHGLRRHLDGARLFNAVVGGGISASDWSRHFDTVNICFSKGLGAPVGSALAGPKDLIEEARRHRKVFGGGMRQAGIIAAGALYALENNVERLAEDHRNAQILAEAIRQTPALTLDPDQVDTNIIIFGVDPAWGDAFQFADALQEAGVRAIAFGPRRVRLITHLDINEQQTRTAAAEIQKIAR